MRDSVKAILEQIIAEASPKSRNLENNREFGHMIFIDYFCQNLSDKDISEEGNNLDKLVAMDYFRRFKGDAKTASSFCNSV